MISKTRKGFTLLEILFVSLILLGLLSLMVTSVWKMSDFSRSGAEFSGEMRALHQVVERMRWELRSLVITPEGTSSFLWSKSGGEGTEVLFFYSASVPTEEGVGEVAYRLIAPPADNAGLWVRYLPYRQKLAFHSVYPMTPEEWTKVSDQFVSWEVTFSEDGETYVKEWGEEEKDPPRRVKVVLIPKEGKEKIEFVVIPGVTAKRW